MIDVHGKLWAFGLELEELNPYLSLIVNIWASDVHSMSKDFLLYKMEMILRTQSGEKVTEVNLCKKTCKLESSIFIHSFRQKALHVYFGLLPKGLGPVEGRQSWKLI